MYWNYRVVRSFYSKAAGEKKEEQVLEIKKIYYDDNDEPILAGDTRIIGETIEELMQCAKDYISALNKPIINYSDIVKKHYPTLFKNDEEIKEKE